MSWISNTSSSLSPSKVKSELVIIKIPPSYFLFHNKIITWRFLFFLSNVKMDRSSLGDTIFPTLEWIALTSNARMDDPQKDKVIYSVFFEKNHLSLLKNSISIIRINNVISIPKTSGFVFKNTETK